MAKLTSFPVELIARVWSAGPPSPRPHSCSPKSSLMTMLHEQQCLRGSRKRRARNLYMDSCISLALNCVTAAGGGVAVGTFQG